MKANDPTHPAFISQQNLGKNPRTDFEDFHYPPIPEFLSLATNSSRLKIPAILTDNRTPPACARRWTTITATRISGARRWSIPGMSSGRRTNHRLLDWEWQGQGMADKFPDRNGVDPVTGMRDENYKGLVTSPGSSNLPMARENGV